MDPQQALDATEAEIEHEMRSSAHGPPSIADVVPWDFVMRWPESVLQHKVWPIVTRMLEEPDPTIRERSLELANAWTTGAALSVPLLLDIAIKRSNAYPEPELRAKLAWVLANLSVSEPAQERKIATAIVLLLGDQPPPNGTTILVVKFHPDELVKRAGRWTESYEDQTAAESATRAFATYRRDFLLAFLAELANRSAESREDIANQADKMLAIPDDRVRELVEADHIPMPTTRPTIDECRRALGLGPQPS